MEELESTSTPGVLQGSGEEVHAGAMKILKLCLKHLQGCLEELKKMPSPKFHQKQCEYLVDKLEEVVEVARSFFELSCSNYCGPDSSRNVTKWVGVFKLMVGLGKQIEDFIVECSKSAWVKAAMTLANVVEYVSSLGFNLELCKVLFSEGECLAMQRGLTLVDVDTLNKAVVEIVKLMAIADKEDLLKKVTLASETSDLAKYLHRRLLTVHPNPVCDEGNILDRLFAWVKSGMRTPMLGEGASAAVYKTMWLGIPVAQKIFFGVESVLFFREVEILSQLCHPNVTSIFSSTMNKGNCSIIMELMDVDLYILIQTRCVQQSDSRPFSFSVSLGLMLQIAKGMNYLHTKRIIHRDLKSKNILVKMVKAAESETCYLHAKVADFGLSKSKEMSATKSCMTFNEGTDRWMAPELVRQGEDDPDCVASSEAELKYKFKCDVYSFAMVCYEILTGEVPFKDEKLSRKIKQLAVAGERPELPRNCPTMLKTLIEKCWNGDPKERPTFGTICSTLQFLKYMLMRGDITLKGLEATTDHTLSNGSGCLAEAGNRKCLSTVKVDVPSSSVFRSEEVGNVLPTIFSPPTVDGFQGFYTYATFNTALSTFPTISSPPTVDGCQDFYTCATSKTASSTTPTMEELETMNDPTGLLPKTEEEVNASANGSIELFLKRLQGCIEALKKMPAPNFNQEQCGYLVDKLEVVVEVARSFFEVIRFQHCGPDSSWNATKWVGIFKVLLALGKRTEDFIVRCSMAAWMEAAMQLIHVAEYVSSLGFDLELCKTLFLEGECLAMQRGLTLVYVDTLNKVEVETVKLKAIVDKEHLLKKVTLASDASNLAKYLLRRLLNNPVNRFDGGSGFPELFDCVESDTFGELLGRGSSGSVYKVMWLGTPVAKKIFFGVQIDIWKEVEILSQLHHPNIISMFAYAMDKRRGTIIMDLMDCDLFSLIQRRCGEHSESPPFSLSESLDLMLQIAEGVNYLHTKGIIHRDLKSFNILVKMVGAAELETGYVEAKVADFGLSKRTQKSVIDSHMTDNVGTFRWMPPELVMLRLDNEDCLGRNERVLHYVFKCDVYSFAMVCYEILTGRSPFKDEWMLKKIQAIILQGERPELPTNCPTMLKALIEKCWNGDPRKRPTFSTICSTLKYLKYMLMRGDITPEGSEARLDQTLSDGSR